MVSLWGDFLALILHTGDLLGFDHQPFSRHAQTNVDVAVLGGAHNEIAQHWKDAQDLSLQRFQNRIWRLALREKLTYHIKLYRGEIKINLWKYGIPCWPPVQEIN